MAQLGVFEDVHDAIDAAWAAQKELMENYTTDDRDRFIAKIKEKFLEIIDRFFTITCSRRKQVMYRNRRCLKDFIIHIFQGSVSGVIAHHLRGVSSYSLFCPVYLSC